MAFWKKLNNTDAVPVLKDEMVLDTTPTVNSTTPVTSDGLARAIAGASGEVPVVTENDNGKVLSAIYDEHGPAVEWADAPSELPSVTGNAGKVLSVNSGATGVEWADAPSGVPEYSAADNGKVLGVVTTGVEETPELDWVEVQSGGGTNVIAGDGLTGSSVEAGTASYTGTIDGDSVTVNFGAAFYPAVANQTTIPVSVILNNTMIAGRNTWAGESVYITATHNGVMIKSPAIGVLVEEYVASIGGTVSVLYYDDVATTSFDFKTWDGYSSTFVGGNSGSTVFRFVSGSYNSSLWLYRVDESDPKTYAITATVEESATSLAVTRPLPDYSSAGGKVLKVSSYGDSLTYDGYPVPAATDADNGKFLMVNSGSYNSFVWGTPQVSSNVTAPISGAGTQANPIKLDKDATLATVASAGSWAEGVSLTAHTGSDPYGFVIPGADALALLNGTKSIRVLLEGIQGSCEWTLNGATQHVFGLYAPRNGFDYYAIYTTATSGGSLTDASVLVTMSDSTFVSGEKQQVKNSIDLGNPVYFMLFGSDSGYSKATGLTNYYATMQTADVVQQLSVANPVPAFDTTTDLGKVLTVTANGLEWVTPT